MKKYLLCIVTLFVIYAENIYTQTNIYKQDFTNGLPSGWLKTSDGWSVAASNSNGYSNSSGGNALRAFYMLGSHSIFTSAISTRNFKEITIIWAERRPYNFDLDIEFSWSLDFANWNVVQYEKSSGDDNWQLVNKAIPIKLNDKCWDRDTVYFRWKFISAISFLNRQMYVDDIQLNGISKLVSVKQEKSITDYKLYQNYPNPFNSATIINYSVPTESDVKIDISDIAGRIIISTLQHTLEGNYSKSFSMNGFASGIYFYTIHAVATEDSRQFRMVKKMILIK